MTASERQWEAARIAFRRRAFLVGAVLLLLYLPLDLRLPAAGAVVAWRLAWILLILVAALAQRPEHPRFSRVALGAAIIGSGAGAVAVVNLAGGTQGGRFGFLLAFPAAVLVLFPEAPLAIAALAAICLAGGVGAIHAEGRDLWFAVEWGVVFAAVAALASVGAVGYRRLRRSELEAQEAQHQALQRLAEQERRQTETEHLASLGQLVAGVAHDIANPLAYVRTNLEALREDRPELAATEPLRDALHGVARIGEIVSDLRGRARAGAVTRTEFSAEAALAEAWRLAAPKLAGLRAEWSAAPGLPLVEGSRRLLVQALLNLLANAAEAAGGMEDPDRRWVTARVSAAGGSVAVVVDDGGPGLPPEVADHLFQLFVSTKGEQGTGFGLALVRAHVAQCGGSVEGGNRPDGGVRFIVKLPARLAAP
jgi:signal transduction histidine kinase